MSDLQVWLLIIGAAIVVVVLLFNWAQERRFRRQAEAAFQAPEGDTVMPAAASLRDRQNRVEPALRDPIFDGAAPDPADHASLREPRLAEVDDAMAPDPAVAAPAAAEPAVAPRTGSAPSVTQPAAPVAPRATKPDPVAKPAPYDELIEYRVRIDSDGVLSSVFNDVYNRARALGKPVRWMGLSEDGVEWEEVQPWRDVHYRQLVVTMQLADRNGAAQDEQVLALCDLLKSTAQANGLRIACDDVVDALERAQAIDRFCVDVDVLIGLNVVARGEGSVNLARIVREAESSGMVLGVDGVFQLLDSRSEPLFVLCNHDAEPFNAMVSEAQTSQGVTLQFDVPRVPDGIKVFDGMVAFGRRLANEVGGILVDDNLRPLTDAGIDKIRSQLTQIYERMEARGVPSGSRRALRLFS